MSDVLLCRAAPLAAEMACRKASIDEQKRHEKLDSRVKHAGAVQAQAHRAVDEKSTLERVRAS
jgi:hypothetical protein